MTMWTIGSRGVLPPNNDVFKIVGIYDIGGDTYALCEFEDGAAMHCDLFVLRAKANGVDDEEQKR